MPPHTLIEQRIVSLVRDRWQSGPAKGRRICLFLGAGADIASGGLTFGEFKQLCFEQLTGTPRLTTVADQDVASSFEQVFSASLPADERSRLVEKLFRQAGAIDPSDSYRILAILLRIRAIDAVITTNFDVMLERAADELGGLTFDVYAPGGILPVRVGRTYLHRDRPPYIKLHGDLASGPITALTQEEIDRGEYEPSILALTQEILSSHHLILVGYSGFDTALARIVGGALSPDSKVFWCNPSPPRVDSPLLLAFAGRDFAHAAIDFERCIELLGRLPLERTNAVTNRATFVRSLMHWRLDFTNEQFIRSVASRRDRDFLQRSVRREVTESAVLQFLRSDKNLAVVVGPSGVGKTTLAARLHSRLDRPTANMRVLLAHARSLSIDDIDRSIVRQCVAGCEHHLGLTALERWLRQEGLRVLVIIDALNEFDSDAKECNRLFRSIVRLAYSLPEASQLRFLVTTRHETWTYIFDHADQAQIASVMWSKDSDTGGEKLSPIALDRFTLDELSTAITVLEAGKVGSLRIEQLSNRDREILRDPYCLHAAHDAGITGAAIGSSRTLSTALVERRLAGSDNRTRQCAIDALTELAATAFERRSDSLRALDLREACRNDSPVEHLIRDSGILTSDDSGLLRFEHDRLQEYFTCLAFETSASLPPLETLHDLEAILRNASDQQKLLAAVRMRLCSHPDLFRLVELGQSLSFGEYDTEKMKRIREFTKEALLEAALEAPSLAHAYCLAVVGKARSGSNILAPQLEAAIQCAVLLPDELGIEIFRRGAALTSPDHATAARIFLLDRLGELTLSTKRQIDLLAEPPFAAYFADPEASALSRVLRLLGMVSALGPDNTTTEEYAAIATAVRNALAVVWPQVRVSELDVADITSQITDAADRYLFNTTEADISSFFSNARRSDLAVILERLAAGAVLTPHDLSVFAEFMKSFGCHLELLFNNLLFSFSSLTDFQKTMELWGSHAATFSKNTPAEELNFYNGVLAYTYIVAAVPYDGSLSEFTTRLIDDLDHSLYFDAGLKRGATRGWFEHFDMMFEDGFNPVAGYPLMEPSRRRRELPLAAYRASTRLDDASAMTHLQIFRNAIERLRGENRSEKLVRLLHALGQSVGFWPIEVLSCLRSVAGDRDPVVRRALIRVLSEAYARRPVETRAYLDAERGSFSSLEMTQIRGAEETRVGQRQFETVEWARLLHFLFQQLPGVKQRTIEVLRILYRAQSMNQFVAEGLVALGKVD